MVYDARRFKAGSGVFKCRVCGKMTRDTGHDEGGVELCRRCYEVSGWENMISDGARTIEDVPLELRDEVRKGISPEKGGVVE